MMFTTTTCAKIFVFWKSGSASGHYTQTFS